MKSAFTFVTRLHNTVTYALRLRTRDGVVIAAWMNMRERGAPVGWRWGKQDVNWQDLVLPIYGCRSLDDGKTWEEPILLNKPWCGCIHSMIQLKNGRIVMFGDSTTAERRGMVQKVYAQRVQESLQSIGSSLSVHNAGTPSNTTRDAKKRLDHDVDGWGRS